MAPATGGGVLRERDTSDVNPVTASTPGSDDGALSRARRDVRRAPRHGAVPRIFEVSAYPTSSTATATATDRSSPPQDPFATRAAAELTATLYGAATRKAIGWLAGFGLLTFAPLAMNSRNGWAFAGLMALAVGCIARWVAGAMFEREQAQAQPMLVLILHAVIGLGWAAAGVAAVVDPYGHGPALVLLATTIVAAASVPMFLGHRDACWWLLAPLGAVPIAMAFSDQPYAWPLAALGLASLGLAAWHADRTQAQERLRLASTARATFLAAEFKRLQQAAAVTSAKLEVRERELGWLWQHSGIGVVRVEGYVIEGMNDTLANLLGRPAEQWVRQDVLSLFAKDLHAGLDAVVKRRAQATAATAGPHRETVRLAMQDGSSRAVDLVVTGSRSGVWLIHDASAPVLAPGVGASDASVGASVGVRGVGVAGGVMGAVAGAASTSSSVGPMTSGPAARSTPLDRAELAQRLQTLSARKQRAAVMVTALTGLEAVEQTHGPGAAARLREATSARLLAICRAEDNVVMLDDACWALLMPGDASHATTELVCERIRSAITTPHTLGGASVQLGATVEAVHCELDVQKAATALALIDDFTLRARTALASLGGPEGALTAGALTASGKTGSTARAAPREDSAVAARRVTAAVVTQVHAPVTLERIHIEPGPEDDDA